MTRRPRLLDLFSGEGGAAVGYHRAWFDVVGVDIANRPRYPYEFHQADAMTWPSGRNATEATWRSWAEMAMRSPLPPRSQTRTAEAESERSVWPSALKTTECG